MNKVIFEYTCRVLALWVYFFICFPILAQDIVYNAEDYFVQPQMWDNTRALQKLVDRVSANGGGVIQMGTGEYTFRGTVNGSRKFRCKAFLSKERY